MEPNTSRELRLHATETRHNLHTSTQACMRLIYLTMIGTDMRKHLPSNEITADGFAPIYHDTKVRLEAIFGTRNEQHWPADEQTCSNCFSVAPPVAKR